MLLKYEIEPAFIIRILGSYLGEGRGGETTMPPFRAALVGRCGFLTYLRRDATALGLLLLSI
jgi:hypothetical protein